MDWRTEISSTGEDSEIRGVKRSRVSEMSFSKSIWLVLNGEIPEKGELEVFETILSTTIDHGIGNPSTVAARTVQSGGNEPNSSVAAGILAMGDKHGGAIEDCMRMLQSEQNPEKIVENKLEEDRKIPGMGHKVYNEEDPRTSKIFGKAEDRIELDRHQNRMKKIRREFSEQKGIELPINVDGAIAAVLSDMDWSPNLGKGIFIISRVPGIVAHVEEERSKDDFRRQDGTYEG